MARSLEGWGDVEEHKYGRISELMKLVSQHTKMGKSIL